MTGGALVGLVKIVMAEPRRHEGAKTRRFYGYSLRVLGGVQMNLIAVPLYFGVSKAASRARITGKVVNTESGLRLIDSIPISTKNAAISG